MVNRIMGKGVVELVLALQALDLYSIESYEVVNFMFTEIVEDREEFHITPVSELPVLVSELWLFSHIVHDELQMPVESWFRNIMMLFQYAEIMKRELGLLFHVFIADHLRIARLLQQGENGRALECFLRYRDVVRKYCGDEYHREIEFTERMGDTLAPWEDVRSDYLDHLHGSHQEHMDIARKELEKVT